MFDRIKILMSNIWSALQPVFMQFITSTGNIVLHIALDIVMDLANQDFSNSEKREIAFNNIKDKLKQSGVQVGDSMINLAIEIAVQNIKKKLD